MGTWTSNRSTVSAQQIIESGTLPTLCIRRVVDHGQNSIDADDRVEDYWHMLVSLLSIHPLKGNGVGVVVMP